MRILIATNQLHDISGSEVVALEFAAYFRSLGHEVDVYANWAWSPMARIFRDGLGIEIGTDPGKIRPTTYDLVYFQHQVAGLFDYGIHEDSKAGTAIVFGRLARRSFLESGGWLHDTMLADHVFANSELTAEHLLSTGTGAPVTCFYNAAPAPFFQAAPRVSGTLKTITVISHHQDPSLLGAARRLSERYTVNHVGHSGSGQRLVTPDLVRTSDLVVSIGKSVPYALASRTPVFVYDHFGGPGYLDEANYGAAARFSFSGRCCERRLDADALAGEIVDGYAKGVDFARRIRPEVLRRFYLPDHLDHMLRVTPRSNRLRAETLARHPFLAQERLLHAHLRSSLVEKMTLLKALIDARQG